MTVLVKVYTIISASEEFTRIKINLVFGMGQVLKEKKKTHKTQKQPNYRISA